MNKKAIYFVSAILVIVCVLLFFITRFYETDLIAHDGFFVTGNKIDKELLSESKSVKNSNVKLVKMTSNDSLYSNLGRVYVGEEDSRTEINLKYPVYSNNGLAIVNFNSKNKLINKKFEVLDSYENFTITGGKLYNYAENEQSDYEDYIFLLLENGSYVNLRKLRFTINNKNVEINVNSIVNFQEDYIKYYSYDKSGKLVFDIIKNISLSDEVSINERTYTYERLLIKLGLREKTEEVEEEIEEEEYILEDTGYTGKVVNVKPKESKYIKPKVVAEDFVVNVYSGLSKLNISDTSGVIAGGINFQFFIGDKLYSRKAYVNSGRIQVTGLVPNTEFRIVGSYKYYDEEGKKMEAIFFEQKVTTGDFKKLDPIEFSFENGNIYSTKIELNEFKIVSSLEAEALKGLSKGFIYINGNAYSLNSNLLHKLITGEVVTYTSPTSLKSNSTQDYEIYLLDAYGNELNVIENTGSTRTSKEAPTATFKVTKSEVSYTEYKFSLKNIDMVNIDSYRYIIFKGEDEIVEEGDLDVTESEQTFVNNSLDPNCTYNVKILGSYDILDGNGTVEDAVLGEGKFTTMPLSSLGYLRVNTLLSDITNTSANVKSTLDVESVSSVLLQLLSSFKIEIKDLQGNVIYTKSYYGENLFDITAGLEISNVVSGLNSMTDYDIVYYSTVTQGSTTESISVITGTKNFRTHKSDAYIEIINKFVNNNMIDFDVRVVDRDSAIESDYVLLEVRDSFSKLVAMERLEINGAFVQLNYNKLTANSNYTFKYYAEEYNVGFDNSTYIGDYVLKNEVINTEDGVFGSIELQDMTRQITGDNLFNISDYTRIRKEGNIGYKKYDLDNNAVMFGGKNGYVNFSYYLPEAFHKPVTVTFEAKYDDKTPFISNAYLSKSYDNTLSYKLDGLKKDGWTKYTFSFVMNYYVGFVIDTPGSRNERCDVWFRNISISIDSLSNVAAIDTSYSLYSNKYRFRNSVMLAGTETIPTWRKTGTDTGNYGEGHARITNLSNNTVTEFVYKGNYDTFTAPVDGDYKIELWGAAGGDGKNRNSGATDLNYGSHGGRGAYTSGTITLLASDKLYVYVGGTGVYGSGRSAYGGPVGGYNGGGDGGNSGSGSGGGATDVRVVSGAWNNESSLKSRIMVAAGGGGGDDGGSTLGGSNDGRGGAGGALISEGAYIDGILHQEYSASQVSGYKFGIGESANRSTDTGGGGGGYFGGPATHHNNGGAGGGSSYISGFKGCVSYSKIENSTTTYLPYTEKDDYLASFNINLIDNKNEIYTNDYYIRIFLDGEEISTSPTRYNLVNHRVENEIKKISLRKNKKYKVALSIKIREIFYEIDSIEINTNTEIRAIHDIEDFFNIHPNGKYVVVNDLDFPDVNRYITNLYGEIDFQGHTIELPWNSRGYLFQYTRGGSIIKNVVINLRMNNTNGKTWTSPFVLYHYGTIDNVQLNVLQSNSVANQAVGLLTYANYSVVKNFVIHTLVEVHCQNRFGLVVYSNQGLVKNGYVYGEDINAYHESPSVAKNTGVIACEATTNSRIQNVFSLITVRKDSTLASEIYTGNLVGYANVGKMENCFSVESDDTATNLSSQDPNFGRVGSMTAKNVFYASKRSYNASLSNKISFLTLYDTHFLNNLLNKENNFNVDSFVKLGYYPQLIMNDCMPNLDWIPLPILEDEDLIDVTSVEEESNDGSSAIVKLHINNPAAEKIVTIGVQDIQTIELLSQENEYGKTIVRAKLSNPLSYKSKYYLRKIISKGQLGYTYETTFGEKERPIDLVMYFPISSIDDWRKLNTSPSDNFALTTDLDFSGVAESKIYIQNHFNGMLNGNGHTIKNITITSKGGVFERLKDYAVIKNLNIENYTKSSYTSYGGFINETYNSITLDNVHIKNSSVKAASYLGALVGVGRGAIIINCSSTGFKSVTNPDMVDIRIGALIGYLDSNGYIANSYAQDFDISILDSISTYGIGGIVGQMSSGSITNVYAIGSIKSNSTYVGGIGGYVNAIVSNCWSDVNIYSELDFVGGILGRRDHDNISSTLVFGPVYSTYDGQNISRTSGNSLLVPQKNYFWDGQQFYGYVVGNAIAESPLSSERINNIETYYDLLDFSDNFDYTGIETGILPKLKSISGDLLPYQKDHKYIPEQFNVRGSIQTTQRVEDGDIYFILENPHNYEITTVSFDYLKIESGNMRITNTGQGYTIVSISNAKPIRYYDAYTLTGVSYKSSPNATAKTVSKFVKVNLQFYKNLSSYTDWRNIGTSTTENYRLTGDIDFSGITNINTNVSIGRLEGQGDGYSIKNINISGIKTTFSLIRKITISMKNVRFENINLATTGSGSYNYCNIIRLNFADIDNVQFNNITINAPNVNNYVAPIGLNRAMELRNISISGNNIKGKSYVGGLLAQSQNYDAFNISASNITVYGSENYVGGIVGYRDYANPTRWFYFSGVNMNVTGKSNTGGLFGYGGANYSTIKDSTIKGLIGGSGSRLGGIAGYNQDRYAYYYEADNIDVIADSVERVGGLFGQSQDAYYGYIKNSRITNNSTGNSYTGGYQGYKSGYSNYYNGVISCKIVSQGTGGTGGLYGYFGGSGEARYSYVTRTEINGISSVGGAIGVGDTTRFRYSTINVKITASGNYVGGVYGYLVNVDSVDSAYSNYVEKIILENSEITGGNSVALFAGYAPGSLYSGFFFHIFLVGNVYTTTGTKYGIVLPQNSNSLLDVPSILPTFFVYTNCAMNGRNINELDFLSQTISNLKIATVANLATQTFYTNNGLSTSYYRYTDYNGTNLITTGYYPFVNTAENQQKVKLPTGNVSFNLNGTKKRFHELPKLDVYSSGISTINIEFSELDNMTSMEVYEGDKLVFEEDLTKRVYTFSYNYKSPIKIVLNDGINTREYKYNAEDLCNLVTTFKDKYAYIYDGKLKGNVNTPDDKFINVNGKYALTENLDVYNLQKSKFESKNNVFELSNLANTVSLYSFDLGASTIDTYLKHSIIHKTTGDITYESQLFFKNGTVEIIDSSLENVKTTAIVDEVGKKSYVTVLGNDGVIYNLKDEIMFPSHFTNSGIKYMSNNINNDSNIVVVVYESGRVVVFDYRTGTQKETEKATKDVSIIDYVKSYVGSNKSITGKKLINDYNESLKLSKMLEEKPISDDGKGNYVTDTPSDDKKSNKYQLSSKYVTYYNVVKNSYDVVNVSDVIVGDEKEIVSENDKIYTSNDLVQIYMRESFFDKAISNVNITVLLGIILFSVMVALGLWFRNAKALKTEEK